MKSKSSRKRSLVTDNNHDLAVMIAKGFAETATKQDVSEIRKDISGMKQDISGMKQDISGMKQDISGLDRRVGKVESRLIDISRTVNEIEIKVDRALYKEIDRLESLIRQLAHKAQIKLEY